MLACRRELSPGFCRVTQCGTNALSSISPDVSGSWPIQLLAMTMIRPAPMPIISVTIQTPTILWLWTLESFMCCPTGPAVLSNRPKFGGMAGHTILGSSEKFLSGPMEAEKSEDQVTLVTQAVGLPQKRFDLIVDAFHAAIVDPVCPPGEDSAFVTEKGLGQLAHLANARFVGPSAPLVEERSHLAIGLLLPEQPQGLFEQIAG